MRISDWSSDVCSSDLPNHTPLRSRHHRSEKDAKTPLDGHATVTSPRYFTKSLDMTSRWISEAPPKIVPDKPFRCLPTMAQPCSGTGDSLATENAAPTNAKSDSTEGPRAPPADFPTS